MKTLFRIFLATAMASAFAAPAPDAVRAQAAVQESAQEAAKTAPFAADAAGIERVESYLNGISTMKADFLQVASSGEVARGTFYLKRPGRLRVEYEESVPVLIVADGHRLIYYDKELETVNMVPIEHTLAAFLARPEIELGGDVKVTEYARERGLIRLTLVRSDEPGSGSLALTLEDDPLRLRQWTVTDAQGLRTRVALQNIEWGLELDRALFDMPRPEEDRR